MNDLYTSLVEDYDYNIMYEPIDIEIKQLKDQGVEKSYSDIARISLIICILSTAPPTWDEDAFAPSAAPKHFIPKYTQNKIKVMKSAIIKFKFIYLLLHYFFR